MSDVRVGMVGSGFMGRTYSECLAKYCRGGRLAAVTGGKRGPGLAADYQVDYVPTLEAMLARTDVDAVLIATPQADHVGQVSAAARAGKHVLVEKPMGLSAAECDAMIAVCADCRVTLSVIQTVRFRGTAARAKQMIEAGKIGAVRMIDLRTVFEWVPLPDETHWLKDSKHGGLVLDQGSHNFDFLGWIAASPPARVFGKVTDFAGGSWPYPTAVAQVEFRNGVLAHSWMSFELPKPGLPNSSFRALIVGEKGMLDVDGYGQLRACLDGQPWERVWEQPAIDFINKPLAPERLEAFYTQVQDFVDSVRERRPPKVTGADGRAAIALIDALRQSSTTGEAVQFPKH